MRKAKGSGFKMRSGNKTSFRGMGSSPVKNVDPSYYSNLIGNLQMTPNQTPAAPASAMGNAAQQAADRQAEIDAFNAANPNYNPATYDFSGVDPGSSIYQPSVSTMHHKAGSQGAADAYKWYLNQGKRPTTDSSDKPNNELANMNLDLESEVLEKIDAPEYDADEGSGSLYDYSVRKGKSAIKKRLPKGKRGYKMKRKKK